MILLSGKIVLSRRVVMRGEDEVEMWASTAPQRCPLIITTSRRTYVLIIDAYNKSILLARLTFALSVGVNNRS